MENKNETPADLITSVTKFAKASPGNMILTILAMFGLGTVAKNLGGK